MEYYKLLGITKDASLKEVKEAYKKLSQKYKDDEKDTSNEEIMKLITEAYDVLSDEDKRNKYDKAHTKKENKKISLGNLLLIIGVILIVLLAIILPSSGDKDNGKGSVTEVTVDKYISLLNGTTKSYIYIGRTGCSYCQKIYPILTRIANETDITINYVNIESISQADYDKLTNSVDVLKGDWGTPTLLIVMNGKVVDSHIGYDEYDVIKKFLLEQK